MLIDENPDLSCKVIAHFIAKQEKNNVRNLMLDDYNFKSKKMTPGAMNDNSKNNYDFSIITIVPVEFEAMGFVFNIDIHKPDIIIESGIRQWDIEIRRDDRKNLSGNIITVGKAGNINCTLTCMRLFYKYNFKLAILSGISAGLKTEVKKYSTVIGTSIVDYEHQRLEEDGKINYRPDPFKQSINNLDRDIQSLVRNQNIWNGQFKDLSKKNANSEIKSHIKSKLFKDAKLKSGVIASGAKLMADGKTLRTLRDDIPIENRIIAAEMEGSGFCQVCNDFNIPWLVFRGISDYGDKDKNKTINKKMQIIAALSSAIAVKNFLEKELTYL